jgi:hypothetical protein
MDGNWSLTIAIVLFVLTITDHTPMWIRYIAGFLLALQVIGWIGWWWLGRNRA